MSTRRFTTRYVHAISPSEKDFGKDVFLSEETLSDKNLLAMRLRNEGVLNRGARIREMRRTKGGGVVVFPVMPGMSTYWHSVILDTPTSKLYRARGRKRLGSESRYLRYLNSQGERSYIKGESLSSLRARAQEVRRRKSTRSRRSR